jgi:hypothetical protein
MVRIRLITYFVCIVFISIATAQSNLVPNGSFEQYYSCPDNTAEVDSCIGWHAVLNTPDYFNTCSPYPVSVPNTLAGDQLPFHGNAYIGMHTYPINSSSAEYREILGTQLISPMFQGYSYNISMRISRGNHTNMLDACGANNKIGMRLTTVPYSLVNVPAINNYAQVYSDSIIIDSVNWTSLKWNYIADSSYSYIYIGNFFDDAHTDTMNLSQAPNYFYYFIDSITIACTDPACVTNISEKADMNSYLNFDFRSSILVIDPGQGEGGVYYITSTSGELVTKKQVNEKTQLSLQSINTGIYIITLVTSRNCLVKKIAIYNNP